MDSFGGGAGKGVAARKRDSGKIEQSTLSVSQQTCIHEWEMTDFLYCSMQNGPAREASGATSSLLVSCTVHPYNRRDLAHLANNSLNSANRLKIQAAFST